MTPLPPPTVWLYAGCDYLCAMHEGDDDRIVQLIGEYGHEGLLQIVSEIALYLAADLSADRDPRPALRTLSLALQVNDAMPEP